MRKIFGYIYILTNKINGKQYVGQTTRLLDRRFKEHMRESQKQCIALHNAVKKHGKSNFSVRILQNAYSRIELDNLEKTVIMKLGTLSPNGYNITEGGKGTSGYKHSDEARHNMSIVRKTGLANGTIPNVWLGRKHTEETKCKLRRPKTEEEKCKMRLAKKGKPSNNGLQTSTEGMKRARKVHFLKLEGLLLREISQETGLSVPGVSLILNGHRFPNVYEELSNEWQPSSNII